MSPAFAFPRATIEFLTDLREHNDKAWFHTNRSRYESSYVEPAKEFVVAVADDLDRIVPGIRAEPRILGSIFRINRDVRFSSDKRPYKDHLDFWFWEGDRKAAVSGLFLRVSPDGVVIGAGAHGFDRRRLGRFRAAVADGTAGAALTTVVEELEQAGYDVAGETYARTPRGFTVSEPAERLLRHSALYVHTELPAEAAGRRGFAAGTLDCWREFAPLHRWLVASM